jgi:hypothetical protein
MKTFILTVILTAACAFCFAQNGPPPTVKELMVADPRVAGLGNRTLLKRYLCSSDSDFVFQQMKDVDGHSDFYASDRYNTSVEIVGDENDTVMIQWTFRMIFNNGQAMHLEVNRMGYFAGFIGGKEGYDWFSSLYLNFKDKPLSHYAATKQLAYNRFADFKYTPDFPRHDEYFVIDYQ